MTNPACVWNHIVNLREGIERVGSNHLFGLLLLPQDTQRQSELLFETKMSTPINCVDIAPCFPPSLPPSLPLFLPPTLCVVIEGRIAQVEKAPKGELSLLVRVEKVHYDDIGLIQAKDTVEVGNMQCDYQTLCCRQ